MQTSIHFMLTCTPAGSWLIRAGPAEIGLVRVEGFDDAIEHAELACDVEERLEPDGPLAGLEGSQRSARDSRPLGHLLGSEALELAPCRQVFADACCGGRVRAGELTTFNFSRNSGVHGQEIGR